MFMMGLGMLMDIASCVLFMRRNRRGHGPSGMPMVSLIARYWLPIVISGRAMFFYSYWMDFLFLTVFHIVLLYVVPICDRKLLVGTED